MALKRRTIRVADFQPDDALEVTPTGWKATGVKARFASDTPLSAGWYQFCISLTSQDRHTIRKRLDLTVEDERGRTISQDSFHWNQTLEENVLVHLPGMASRVFLTLTQAEGEFTLPQLELTKLRSTSVLFRAVKEKLRLLSTFGCRTQVLRRGFGMLLRCEFRGILRKITQGLFDGRAMRQGGYKAQAKAGHWMKALSLKADEADASWRRKHALPVEEAEKIRAECDAMTTTEPIALLLVVDPQRMEMARLAALSVRRQLFPHWELLLAFAGPLRQAQEMATWLGTDPRVRIVHADSDVSVAVARAIQQTECSCLLPLPDEVELTEDALFHLAKLQIQQVEQPVIFAESPGSHLLALIQTSRMPDHTPKSFEADSVVAWLREQFPKTTVLPVPRELLHPIEEQPLFAASRVEEEREEPGDLRCPTPPNRTNQEPSGVSRRVSVSIPLRFGADVLGLSGWDHVAYAALTGMPSLGVRFVQHPDAKVRPDLVPPRFLPHAGEADWQLVIAPPFLADRFQLNQRTLLWTMWETDALRPAEVAVLNKAGRILVPSKWGAGCFRQAGVSAPISVVPLGFDPLVYSPTTSFPDVCTFGTAGALAGGGLRKNAQHIIDLFRKAFPNQERVRLRVKITPSSPAVQTHGDPRIDVLRAALPNRELAEWYRSLTVYVNGSFGEGFGLHLIEAMACGRAIISAKHSGLTEYFDEGVGYVVPHKLVPVRNDVYIGHWAEPCDASIVETMRRIFAHQEEAREFGEASATRARRFTWKAAGRELRNCLKLQEAA